MSLIDDLSGSLKGQLKKGGDFPDLVAVRTAIQVMNPSADDLTRGIIDLVNKYTPEFSGTFLDVGCYGGWLYPYVRDRVDYHGIDIWKAAIYSAQKMFGDRFEVSDLFDYEKKHDVVWCTQIRWDGNELEAWEKCKSLANKLCVFTTTVNMSQLLSGGYTEMGDKGSIVIWRSSGG